MRSVLWGNGKMKKSPWFTAAAVGLVFVVVGCAYGLGEKMAALKYQYQSIATEVKGNQMTNAAQTLILAQIKDSLHELDKSIATHTILLDALKGD